MRIEWELKLGFKDVLIKPKRSTLKVEPMFLYKEIFLFKHSQYKWSGIPIMASNMDSVGTFSMVKSLSKEGLFTVLHKHYHLDQWKDFLDQQSDSTFSYFSLSTGSL